MAGVCRGVHIFVDAWADGVGAVVTFGCGAASKAEWIDMGFIEGTEVGGCHRWVDGGDEGGSTFDSSDSVHSAVVAIAGYACSLGFGIHESHWDLLWRKWFLGIYNSCAIHVCSFILNEGLVS